MTPGPHDAHHEHEHPAPGEGRDALHGQPDIGSVEAVRHDAALETSERGDYEAVQHAADHRVGRIEAQTDRHQIQIQQERLNRERAFAAGQRVVGRASQNIEGRIGELQENGLSAEEARAQAYDEALHEEYANSRETALHRLALLSLPNRPPEEVAALQEKLTLFFKKYATADDPTGMNNFHREVDEAYAEDDEFAMHFLHGDLTNTFGTDAILIFGRLMNDQQIHDAMFEMREAHVLHTAAHHDARLFLQNIDFYRRERKKPAEHYAEIRRSFAASGSTELRSAVEFTEAVERQAAAAETEEIVEETSIEDAMQSAATEAAQEEELEAEEEPAAEGAGTTEEILDELNIPEEQMAEIPQEGREAMAGMVQEEGGGIVLGALFTGEFSVGEGNVSGEIAGSEVELNFGTRQLAIRGHETGTRYPLPGVRPEHYDLTRLYELGMEDAHLSLGQKESFATAFAYTVADLDAHDSELMRERDAHRYHKYMGLLLGRGVDADVELARLRRLGALAEGDAAVPSRLQELASAIAHYVPTEGEGGIHSSGPVGYEDFVTLADLWEEGGFALPDLAELKELTAERLEQESGS